MAVFAQERQGGAYEGQTQLRVFKLFKCTYVFLPSQQTFKPLDAMPAHLPRQIVSALDDLRTINTAGLILVSLAHARPDRQRQPVLA